VKNFISLYKQVVSHEDCKSIINWFEENPQHHHKGVLGDDELNLKKKKSTDLSLSSQFLKVPSLKPLDIALTSCLNRYEEENHFLKEVSIWGMEEYFIIKRYYPKEGYYIKHCENTGLPRSEKRMLVWMLYLNDVDDGGGTAFPTQELEIQARCGDMVIWPAYWTHPHHGIVSSTQTKYIASGWFIFKK
jgi:hypothetical protein|tara:strand:- start:63 stop:629 length:567 start_codon:yes stop_codon:yes gene_type:complete